MLLGSLAVDITGIIHIKNYNKDSSRKKKQKGYYTGWQYGPYNTAKGEEALWAAVIAQAMTDALVCNRKSAFRRYKKEAVAWLTGMSNDFIDVCERACLNPDYVRIRAKKAFANPKAYRIEAGESERYIERKDMRARKRKRRRIGKAKSTKPTPPSQLVLQGPWEAV